MNKEIKTIVLRDVKEIKGKVTEKPEREFQVDLYWKARNFKTYDKTIDWYWFYWTTFALLIFVLIKFTDNKFLWILLILIAILNFLNLKFGQTINEYRINNQGIILANGKLLPFSKIISYNIDEDEMEILIHKEGSSINGLLRIPYEENHNIEVIDQVLSKKIKKNPNLRIPPLEKIILRFLGY